MRALPLLCAALFGCTLTDLPSNLSDSGITCVGDGGISADAGSLGGPRAFAVASAYEVLQQNGDRERLSVQLYEQARACDSVLFRTNDGGTIDGGAYRFGDVTAVVNSAIGQSVRAGTFPIDPPADGGAFSEVTIFRAIPGSDGGQVAFDYLVATAGTVTLSSIEACRVSGSFAADLRESDGGSTPMNGVFSAVFCPSR